MKLLKAILLIPILLALCVGAALAKPAPQRSGPDPSFGRNGTTAVSVPKQDLEGSVEMAIAPSGKTYVLDGSLLLAFKADGRPDTGFGKNGRVRVASATGKAFGVTDVAVDALGRVLISGSVDPTGAVVNWRPPNSIAGPGTPSNAFLIRYLRDGERDPAFGSAGQIDVTVTAPPRTEPGRTHLESSVVLGSRVAVIDGDVPVLGGSYWYYNDYCYPTGIADHAFVAPIAAGGGGSQTLSPSAYTELPEGGVRTLAPLPAGDLAALSSPPSGCDHHGEPGTTTISNLTYGGTPAPALDPDRPPLRLDSLAADGRGRMLGLEGPAALNLDGTSVSWKLMRLLPNGDFDPSFGDSGGLPLKKFGEEEVGGLVVDSKGRVVVGGGERQFRLVRIGTTGKTDHGFGKGGWIEVSFGSHSTARLATIGADSKGRLLAAGPVKSSSLKAGAGIGLTRILPGN
jgi:hypothetical protein